MKFFQIIDNSFIGRFVDKRFDLIASTDPERIYVENIRSFYSLTTPIAKTFCEMAVKEHLFNKHFGIECPNENCQRIIASYTRVDDLPETITCEHCQLLENDKYQFDTNEYNVTEFYKLNRKVV
jgi:hypothetical protein